MASFILKGLVTNDGIDRLRNGIQHRRRLFCVSGIHRERNHGSTTSTRPITVHERTAMCKSQLEPIIESTGNTRGAEQAFGR